MCLCNVPRTEKSLERNANSGKYNFLTWISFLLFFFFILPTTTCVLSYLILSQWRVMFVGQASLDERRQRLGPPLSHPGIRVLADLQGTPQLAHKCRHVRTTADKMQRLFRAVFPSSVHGR